MKCLSCWVKWQKKFVNTTTKVVLKHWLHKKNYNAKWAKNPKKCNFEKLNCFPQLGYTVF